jgi:hypothetical protein
VSGHWEAAVEAGAEAVATEDGDDEIYPYHEHEAAQVIRAALPHLRRHIISELTAKYEKQLVEVERDLRFDDISNIRLWHTINTLSAELAAQVDDL